MLISTEANTCFHSGNKRIPGWIMTNNELHVVLYLSTQETLFGSFIKLEKP